MNNIFEMYYKNNKKCGFFVKRDSWSSIIALVISIDKYTTGPLKGLGGFPYFNKAKENVYCEHYDIERKGNDIYLSQKIPRDYERVSEDSYLAKLSCPGTYGYKLLDFKKKNIYIKKINDSNFKKIII